MSSETLRVLRQALDLGTFTIPELSDVTGVNYETVKKVLRDERDEAFSRTGEKARSAVGRPSDIWAVTDPGAVTARIEKLGAAAREVAALAADLPQPAEPVTAVLVAEDLLLAALSAADPDDATLMAGDALGALRDADLPAAGDVGVDVPTDALGRARNVPLDEGRARVVSAVAKYLMGTEAQGLGGPFWRAAFDAVASFHNPSQYGLHKDLLRRLVQLAAERSRAAGVLRDLPQSEVTELVWRMVRDSGSSEELIELERKESPSARASLHRAVVDAVGRIASEPGAWDECPKSELFTLASAFFGPGRATDPDDRRRLVAYLVTCASGSDLDVASAALTTLLAIREPTDEAFWLGVARSEALRPELADLFGALGRSSVSAAFTFLRDELAKHQAIEGVLGALTSWFHDMDAGVTAATWEAFVDFLCDLNDDEQRRRLAVAPELAGRDVPAMSFERAVVQQFFSKMERWRSVVRAGDSAAVRRHAGELAHDITQLAPRAFPLLDRQQERRAYELLTSESDTPEGATLAAQALLAAEREGALVEHLTRRSEAAREPARQWFVSWYTGSLSRAGMDIDARAKLVAALYHSLPADDGKSFLIALVRSAEVVAELVENRYLPPELCLSLESLQTNRYRTSAIALGKYEREAEFMVASLR